MKKKILAISSAVLLILASCNNEKFPGYTESEPGIFYKLHVPGETQKKAGENDYYEIRMQNRFGGKVFYDSQFQTGTGTMFVQAQTSKYFTVLGEGDSATFLLPGSDLHMIGTPDTGMVEMNVKVIRILSAAEYEKISSAQDPDTDEQLIIERYRKINKIKEAPDSTGLVFMPVSKSGGAGPSGGKNITINYKGAMMNGTVFDDTHGQASPFTFIWGQEDQVIPGIQLALRRMHAGEKAKIILPSALAFGTNGSSNGIVPPHTPVVYELELVSIQ